MPLFCRLAIPLHSFVLILYDTILTFVAPSKAPLRFGISLFRRLAIPSGSFCVILSDGLSILMCPAWYILHI